MDTTINNMFINSICGKTDAEEITVTFKDGQEATYTINIFDALI